MHTEDCQARLLSVQEDTSLCSIRTMYGTYNGCTGSTHASIAQGTDVLYTVRTHISLHLMACRECTRFFACLWHVGVAFFAPLHVYAAAMQCSSVEKFH